MNKRNGMIVRTPTGQWCDPFSAISYWMPQLLRQSSDRWFAKEPLNALARYCVDKAADLYAQASQAYKPTDGTWRDQKDADASWGHHRHAAAQDCR